MVTYWECVVFDDDDAIERSEFERFSSGWVGYDCRGSDGTVCSKIQIRSEIEIINMRKQMTHQFVVGR